MRLHLVLTSFLAGTTYWAALLGLFLLRGGESAVPLFQFIASGLLGQDAYQLTPWIPYIGVAIHYLIAFGWSWLTWQLYPRLLQRLPSIFIQAAVVGLIIWLVMNLLIIPLSRATPVASVTVSSAVLGIVLTSMAFALPSIMRIRSYTTGSR